MASGSSSQSSTLDQIAAAAGSSQSQPSTSRRGIPSIQYAQPTSITPSPYPRLPTYAHPLPSSSRYLDETTPVVQARFKFPYKVGRPVVRESVYLLTPSQNYYVALSRSLSNLKVKMNKTLTKEIALEKKRKAEAAAKLEKPKKIRKIIV